MNLVLRLDADRSIGFGHAVRTSALVAALAPARITVCGNADAGLSTLFPGAALESAPADPIDCARLIGALAPDLVVCDLPYAQGKLWHSLRRFAKSPVVAIDDYGGEVDADLIVNGTVLPEYHCYPAASVSTEVLVGGDYALLRAPFGLCRWQDRDGSRVTVIVGSGSKAADWLERLLDGEFFARVPATINVIVGWGFARPELLDVVRRSATELSVGLDADSLARRLVDSSVVLCTGGMIVYEALAVGAPAIVFPQEESCVGEVRWFAARGALIDVGPGDCTPSVHIEAHLAALLLNRERRRELSRRGSALIDGGGATRIASRIRARLM